ncbi:MAG: hypothetical protein ACREHE_04975 [Rhizomicrobium sp.]
MRLAALALLGALIAAPSLAAPPVPDFAVVPMTQADVDLYLGILRAAAAHNQHLTGDDKLAVDLSIQSQKGAMPKMDPSRMANLMARAAILASYDEEVAKQRGVSARYDAIKNEMETVLAQVTGIGGSCGGDCSPPGGFSAAVLARAKKEQAAADADKPLVKPHVAEIKALKKQIGGFMFGGQ